MMADVAEIYFKADTKDLVTAKRDLDSLPPAAKRAEQAAENLSGELKKTNGAFGDLASGTGKASGSFGLMKIAAGAVAGAIAAIAASARGSYSAMTELSEAAKTTAVSFDSLQKSRFAAASLGGLGGGEFYKGVNALGEEANKNFREGEGKIKEIFEANNLSITDRAGRLKDVNALLLDSSTLIQNAKTEFDKIEIAKILGLSKEWVDALENGPGAFKNAGMEATKSGAIIDSELVKRAGEFDKSWSQSSEVFSIKMKAAIAGVVVKMLNFIDLAKNAFSWIGKLKTANENVPDTGIGSKQNQAIERAYGRNPALLRNLRATNRLNEIGYANTQPGWNTIDEPIPPSRPSGLGTPSTKIPNKSGGGGGSGAAEKELSDLQKIAEAYKTLSEPFNQANTAFTGAKTALENGLITNEAYAQSLGKIKDAFMAAGGTSDQWAKLVTKNTDDVSDKMEKFAEKSLKKVGDEFVDMAFKGKFSFGDLAKSIVKDLVKIAFQAMIVKPLLGLFGGFKFGDGGTFGGDAGFGSRSIVAAAKGRAFDGPHMFAGGGSFANSVVSKATPFNFAGGKLGVMGEAGPEAVVPLARGADGSLGVQMHGNSGKNRPVENNVQIANNFTISGAVSSKDIEASIRATAEQTQEDVKKQLVGWLDQFGRDGAI